MSTTYCLRIHKITWDFCFIELSYANLKQNKITIFLIKYQLIVYYVHYKQQALGHKIQHSGGSMLGGMKF